MGTIINILWTMDEPRLVPIAPWMANHAEHTSVLIDLAAEQTVKSVRLPSWTNFADALERHGLVGAFGILDSILAKIGETKTVGSLILSITTVSLEWTIVCRSRISDWFIHVDQNCVFCSAGFKRPPAFLGDGISIAQFDNPDMIDIIASTIIPVCSPI